MNIFQSRYKRLFLQIRARRAFRSARAFMLMFFLLPTAGMTICAQSPAASRTPLAGLWEGTIKDPKRPIVVQIDFTKSTAKLDTAGSTPYPLVNASDNHAKVIFHIQIGAFKFDFTGRKSEAEMSGTVRFAGKQLPFSFKKLPVLPAPTTRIEAWQQDIDALTSRFLLYDRSFTPQAREAFRTHIASLRRTLQYKSDQAIMVALARTLALAHNGHTRLYLMRNRTEVRQLPIRVWWFKDSLRIIRATPEHADLLGCSILKIGSLPIMEAFARMHGIDSGSESWQRYMSSYFLTSPDVLYGASLIRAPDQVSMQLFCNGQLRAITLTPLSLRKSNIPDEVWWNLAPSYHDPNYDLVPALKEDSAPLYLLHPQENYWFKYLPEESVLYLQYNRAQEMQLGLTVNQFKDAVEHSLDQKVPKALIFDLRFNTGGNGYLAEPLIKMIAAHAASVPVYVITGRATFSAGVMAAAELRQWAHATIVGEPAGDGLDFWAEGGNFILPNSGLAAHYANGFHAYSRKPYPGQPVFFNLNVDTIQPEIAIEPTWTEYMDGEDMVLNSILDRIPKTNSISNSPPSGR